MAREEGLKTTRSMARGSGSTSTGAGAGAGVTFGDEGKTQAELDKEAAEYASVYHPGESNVAFIGAEYNPAEWMDTLSAQIGREFFATFEAAGRSEVEAQMAWNQQWTGVLQLADLELFQGKPRSALGRSYSRVPVTTSRDTPEGGGGGTVAQQGQYFLQGEGFLQLLDYARARMQLKNPDLEGLWTTATGGGGGGGGGGSTGLTPEQIRNKFDIAQLAAAAQNQWRGLLLTEMDNPRDVATAYVDAVVATQGEQAIDFDEFVRKRIKETDRYNSIYAQKPKSMTEEQFLQPYFQSAQEVMGASKDAAGVAIGGAQFHASGASFGARLNRTGAVTSSAPFINNLEARLGDLKEVFKG